MPVSPKSYGRPSNTTPTIKQEPIKKFDGKFIKARTLAEEMEDKDILNWLYKDEEETMSTSKEVIIPIEWYGNGFLMMQSMGYKGKGPLGKHLSGIIETIKLQTKSKKHKASLRYNHNEASNKKKHPCQNPKSRKKTSHKEDPWQVKLHQAMQELKEKQDQEAHEKEQE